MLTIRDKNLVTQIKKHSLRIIKKTSKLSQSEFDKNEDIIEVVCFNLIQIGEIAKRLSDDFVSKYNKIPWKQIKGIRDKIVHDYCTIDLITIWETSKISVPELQEYCTDILKGTTK